MWRHIVRHPELLEPAFGVAHAQAELRRASIGPLIYVLAVPLALFLLLAALLFYIGVAVIYALTSQGAASG